MKTKQPLFGLEKVPAFCGPCPRLNMIELILLFHAVFFTVFVYFTYANIFEARDQNFIQTDRLPTITIELH